MDTVRVFVRWAEGIEAVENGLSERVQSPDLGEGDNVRHEELDSATATAVLTTLEKYHYCTLPHVTLALMWHTMCRRGAVRALDVDDYDARDEHLRFVHRPETGTPLKKQEKSERYVAISDSMAELLDDWLDRRRPDVTDEFGREPLLATVQGRAHVSTIASYAHRYTQPCVYAGECPLSRDPDTCESTNRNKFSSCPESVSPHPIRRGSITHWLRSDVPPRVVSDRADVSEKVIDRHYDERSLIEQMEQRRDFLGNV
jgi:integrase